MLPLFIPPSSFGNKPFILSFIIGSLFTIPVIYGIPYYIPAYRTSMAIVNKNLQIINTI